jgi:tricorn protease
VTADCYARYPHVGGELVTFVAEDDVWLGSTGGGRAYRVSSDQVPAASPRLSPDRSLLAWTARRGGTSEVFVAPTEGGVSRQLTFWGQQGTRVTGWVSDDEVLVLSATGESNHARMYAHAVAVDGGPSRRLPYGWAGDLAFGPAGGVLLSTYFWTEPARWKRYRGGTASQLWLDLEGDGTFERVFADLPSNLASPVWVTSSDGAQRIGFCSDHEGRGQLYSAVVDAHAPATAGLARHTDGDLYVRHASTDGRQVVFCRGGDLFLLDSLDVDAEPRRLDMRLGSSRALLRRRRVKVTRNLENISPDRTGRASAIESRGTISWVSHRDGPVRSLVAGSQVRRRLPVVLDDRRVAWVTDAHGDDAVEILGLDGPEAGPRTLLASGRVGRVLEMAASPDGRQVALATHDGRLVSCEVPRGDIDHPVEPRELDATTGDMSGLSFSPDSRWLAWSASGPGPWEDPGPRPLRQIKMADLTTGQVFPVTSLRFTDTEPVFTLDGRHLAFLSIRSLDPVYDAFSFDLSFPGGCRPFIVPLARDTASPFDPMVGGRPVGATDASNPETTPPTTHVDVEGLEQRLIAVPVEGGRYSHLAAVNSGLAWAREPLLGELGEDLPKLDDEAVRARVEHFALRTSKLQTIVGTADRFVATTDGTRLVVLDKGRLRLVPSDRPSDKEGADEAETVQVALDHVDIEVDPPAEWRQMYDETWRLMRDHFWRADMGGVDWAGARERYLPLLDRIGSYDDLVDLIWEMHGELGSSHAYCIPPQDGADSGGRQGLLGADLEYTDGEWRIVRIVPGEASDRRARSPLLAPGIGAAAGDAIVAVDGRPTSRTRGPLSFLVGAADRPVELTVRPRSGADLRRVVVVPLADETPLRYQDWVNGRRAYVHEHTEAKVGYLHVPDMMSGGWAQLHRDLRTELNRDAVIVDVRSNSGGHTSQLVVEKLARRIIGWNLVRGYGPDSYPTDARRGPMVTVADMYAGSDGDIITAAIQALGLGPVVGTRTWGGVIGIDGRYRLVDGTMVTQPRYSFWFQKFGWTVENHGVDPDVEVPVSPQDRVADNDVQLDHALDLVQNLLRETPPQEPPPLPAV